jgi:hypothetical protein
LIGTTALVITAAGILAGNALAQATPDWPERAVLRANAKTSGLGTVGTASRIVPAPDWLERAVARANVKTSGIATVATASAVVPLPDWVQRAARRTKTAPLTTVLVVPDILERATLRSGI